MVYSRHRSTKGTGKPFSYRVQFHKKTLPTLLLNTGTNLSLDDQTGLKKIVVSTSVGYDYKLFSLPFPKRKDKLS